MKKVFSTTVGIAVLSAVFGVSSGWSAEKSLPSIPQAPEKLIEKAVGKTETVKGEHKGEHKDKKELLDINSASEKEIQALKGVDGDHAKKIVKNRPYARKDELVSKKIISEAAYDKIKDQIVAKQPKAAAAKATDVKSAVTGALESLTDKTKK